MRAHADAFLNDVRTRLDSPEAGIALRICGVTHQFAGEYTEARKNLERALALFQPGRDDDLAIDFGLDAGVTGQLCLAIASWPLGEIAYAASLFESAQARMATISLAGALAFGRQHSALFQLMRRDRAHAAQSASELGRLAREYDLAMFQAFAVFLEGWTAPDQPSGLQDMRRGADLLREQKVLQFDGLLKTALAEAEAGAGDPDRAVAIVKEALATVETTGYRAFEAELHRVRGEILLKRDPANPATAEEALQTAIAVAKRQATRSFGLRASLSLAKLYRSAARAADAHAVLAAALEGFSPTPEMPEIAEAQALLSAPAATDDVKAEAARRERRTKLQLGMATALLQGRGMQTPEARAAFERAGDIAAEAANPMERLVILHGLWSGELGRGEARRMLEIAASMAPVAAREPSGQGALVAERVLGVSQFFAGDLASAELNMQSAVDHYDFDRDHGHAIRFAHDQGVGAQYYLAFAKWMLGDAEAAFRLIGEPKRLAERVAHPPTSVAAHAIAAWLDIVRGDPIPARANAETALALARDFDLPLWRSLAESVVAWTTAASERMRAAWDQAEALWAASLAQGAGLAEPSAAYIAAGYAALGDFDRALALVDRALSGPAERGLSVFLPEANRVRGEILFKRDPADPAPAEQSLLASISSAREQGSRSFALRAALSLAKLYQSTGRPVEAHAVLAPVLEGFPALSLLPSGRKPAPSAARGAGDEGTSVSNETAGPLTPDPSPARQRGDAAAAETPEIAEAQALLATLAENDEVRAEAA
jgi:tetratricopeptide (TPR) repeat protein